MRETVERGVIWLDRTVPNWREKASRTLLDMGNMKACLLFQVFGDYKLGADQLPYFTLEGKEMLGLRDREEYWGFSPKENMSDKLWDELTELWKEEL